MGFVQFVLGLICITSMFVYICTGVHAGFNLRDVPCGDNYRARAKASKAEYVANFKADYKLHPDLAVFGAFGVMLVSGWFLFSIWFGIY
jgi:hypothetical protein